MLQLITDGRRLTPAGDVAAVIAALEAQAAAAVAGGVDFIQVREPWLEAGVLYRLVRALLPVVRGSATRLLVNDRLDVALAAGAGGVHLKSESIAPAEARRLAPPGFFIGLSVHTVEEARRAEDADYLVAGTVWPTASKTEGHACIGVDGLRAIVRATSRPVLAIGGVTGKRLAEVAATGAAGLAAISFFNSTGSGLTAIIAAAHRFDTPESGS